MWVNPRYYQLDSADHLRRLRNATNWFYSLYFCKHSSTFIQKQLNFRIIDLKQIFCCFYFEKHADVDTSLSKGFFLCPTWCYSVKKWSQIQTQFVWCYRWRVLTNWQGTRSRARWIECWAPIRTSKWIEGVQFIIQNVHGWETDLYHSTWLWLGQNITFNECEWSY